MRRHKKMKSKDIQLMEIFASDDLYILKDQKESKVIYTLKRYLIKAKLFCIKGFPKHGDIH